MTAIIDLGDRAPQWARTLGEWRTGLIQALDAEDPIEKLRGAQPEFELPEDLLHDAAEAVASMPGEALARIAPSAVGAAVEAHARADLLRSDGGQSPSPDLLATLALQSRALTSAIEAGTHVHPYAIYQVARGLRLSSLAIDPERRGESEALDQELERLKRVCHELTERLLARCRIGSVRDGEAVALVFCAATLAFSPDDPRYVIEALNAGAAAQGERGDWPEGRTVGSHVDPDGGGRLTISSNEVGVAFAEAAFSLALVPGAKERLPSETSRGLERCVSYLRESRVSLNPAAQETSGGGPIVGWAAEQVYGRTSVDARATAAALRLAVATRALAEQERSVQAIANFEGVWYPSDHTPPYLVWQDYKKENEPDARNPILPYLDEHFVLAGQEKRKHDRRPWARTESMSLILFGPPGTTKTTIVKSMAQGLEWPLVTLSPGTFIRDGLENVEKRAIEVFAHLQDLARVVVLFDECDELFRARRHQGSAGGDEMRSISAFMTASMLPKLQDLRDNGQVFFVIATNYFDQIDSAAKRIGRIDRIVGVSWPDPAQRGETIRRQVARVMGDKVAEKNAVKKAIAVLAEQTRYFVRGELIELANELAVIAPKLRPGDAVAKAEKLKANKEPAMESLDWEAFKSDAAERSACHESGRGELKT